jgi:hypothetical protein
LDRIEDLTRRINALRDKRLDEALHEITAQWPKTSQAVEGCTTFAPEVRKKWLERLNAIRYTSSRSNTTRLEEMASDINGVAENMAKLSEDLRAAGARRERIPLAEISPVCARALLLRPLYKGRFDLSRLNSLAEDLQQIHDRVQGDPNLPFDLRVAWLNQLERIDTPFGIVSRSCTSAERARKLATAIDAAHDNIRAVVSSLRDQAAKYRSFWDM